MSNITINTLDFRSKMWEPLYQATMEAIYNETSSSWNLGGGAASGKTQIAHRLIITGLIIASSHYNKPFLSLVYLYESEQKERITKLFMERLEEWNIPFAKKENRQGTVVIRFTNNNEIHIFSAKGSSNSSVEEKFKTPITDKKNILFIWMEEFTAIYNTMKSQKVYSSAMARLKRQCAKGHVIMHTYNPPDNTADPIIAWARKKSNVDRTLLTNIYDLPPKFQDEETLALAQELKNEDEMLWRNVYLGENVGSSGLAYPNFKKYAVIDELTSDINKLSVWIDNGTLHATVFQLHGETLDGKSILLDTKYHSGRISGMKSSATYVKDFKEWALSHKLNYNTYIVADDRDFTLLLQEAGFKNAKWISDEITKDVYRSYKVTKLAIDKGIFKVLNTPNNNIVIQQFENLTTTTKKYSDKYKVIPKKTESNDTPEERTMHGVDPCHYKMLTTGIKLGIYRESEEL